MPNEPVETVIIPETDSQAVVLRPEHQISSPGLFGTTDPAKVIEKAAEVATALRAVITKQGLISRIQGKDYPKCEAWTLLGTMIGVFPVLVWTRQLTDGWEARVEAKTRDGAIVGAAEAQCLKSEKNWSNRDDFALRSMAQTRATSKCLRMPLGFVMTLGGFEATPAEEMVSDHPQKPAQSSPKRDETPKAPPKSTSGPKLKPPSAATRLWMIDQISKNDLHDIAVEYFRKLGPPSVLMPNEGLADVPLWSVPNCHAEMSMLITRIKQFANGERAEPAFPPHDDAEDPSPPTPAAASLPKGPVKNPEWWRDIIVPIPRKGQRMADYVGKEDTLGSLFDLRHGNDEEAQAARQRLWGMVEFRSDPNKLTNKEGTIRKPTDVDIKFAEALQAFKAWFADTHRGEKL